MKLLFGMNYECMRLYKVFIVENFAINVGLLSKIMIN